MNKCALILLSLLFSSSSVLWGQIDPRIASVLGNLSPQQKQMIASSVGMLEQRKVSKQTDSSDESQSDDQVSEETSSVPEEEEAQEEKVDILQKLIFLEQLLINDLSALEEVHDEEDSEELSANDKLRRIESLEQTKRLLYEIKQKQRDEIEKQSDELLQLDDEKLKPFGHDFFINRTNYEFDDMSFVASNYEVGPGDVLEVLLFGQKNEAYNLLINRDGIIQFPHIGPINVFEQGTEFINLKNAINQKIKEHLGEGVQSSITLGALRSIPVLVLGQVKNPGNYLLSPHSSIIDALRIAGGINPEGSMRKISLKRQGKEISILDLYDLLLHGNSANNNKLESGDVVFVPVVGSQVRILGEVHVPAIYELTKSVRLVDFIKQIGGINENGFSQYISLKRRNSMGRFDLRMFSLDADNSDLLHGGDIVEVSRIEDRFDFAVEVFGPVERPGLYQWTKGMSLQSLFTEFGSFLDHADLRLGFVVRENEFRELSVYHFSPRKVIKGEQKIELFQNDRIYVLSTESGSDRMKDIRRLILELKKHTPNGLQAKFVSVDGEVHFPGEYPLSETMTARDLILAGGGLTDASYSLGAELTRIGLDNDNYATVDHVRIKPQALRDGNQSEKFYLKPYDSLSIKPIPSWRAGETIQITGEVNFPGKFVIRPGEKLSEVIERAGGLTKRAFPAGAVFTRKSLAEKESEQRERLIARLEADLAEASLQALNAQEAARSETAADAMLKRLQNTQSIGRLVINLSDMLISDDNIFTVKDGDTLHIPDQPSSVSVAGEVQFPTAHLHDESLNLDDYLKRSGGFTRNADEDRIFVVKANGSVQAKSGNKWFGSDKGSIREINPGDVIVIPIDVKQSRVLEQLSYTSQIIYQMAVAAAAVNSF